MGELLVVAGVLSYRQLEAALAEQALRRWQKRPARLGEILLDLQIIDGDALEAQLSIQYAQTVAALHPWPIGQYLAQAGTITQAQLEQALELQAQWQAYGRETLLGDVLVALAYITQYDLDQIVTHWQDHYHIDAVADERDAVMM